MPTTASSPTDQALADALRRKEQARMLARALSWPEKVDAIERMREASRLAREGMRQTEKRKVARPQP